VTDPAANETGRRGKRLALKYAAVQLAGTGVVAFVFLAVSGGNAARSAVAGGLIIALGTLVFAWRLFATSWPAASAARGFYAGELLKWVWVLGAFALALTRGGMEPLPLLLGLLAGQCGFWVAMGIFK
jgi:F0F1-type ATP synthase assembly protein I